MTFLHGMENRNFTVVRPIPSSQQQRAPPTAFTGIAPLRLGSRLRFGVYSLGYPTALSLYIPYLVVTGASVRSAVVWYIKFKEQSKKVFEGLVRFKAKDLEGLYKKGKNLRDILPLLLIFDQSLALYTSNDQ